MCPCNCLSSVDFLSASICAVTLAMTALIISVLLSSVAAGISVTDSPPSLSFAACN